MCTCRSSARGYGGRKRPRQESTEEGSGEEELEFQFHGAKRTTKSMQERRRQARAEFQERERRDELEWTRMMLHAHQRQANFDRALGVALGDYLD